MINPNPGEVIIVRWQYGNELGMQKIRNGEQLPEPWLEATYLLSSAKPGDYQLADNPENLSALAVELATKEDEQLTPKTIEEKVEERGFVATPITTDEIETFVKNYKAILVNTKPGN